MQQQLVDVDFEFFDPRPIDFHALKRLLIQLFSADSEMFSLSELTELILSQPLLGSTVKVDGPESDPFALLTVLNMNDHKVYNQFMKPWWLLLYTDSPGSINLLSFLRSRLGQIPYPRDPQIPAREVSQEGHCSAYGRVRNPVARSAAGSRRRPAHI